MPGGAKLETESEPIVGSLDRGRNPASLGWRVSHLAPMPAALLVYFLGVTLAGFSLLLAMAIGGTVGQPDLATQWATKPFHWVGAAVAAIAVAALTTVPFVVSSFGRHLREAVRADRTEKFDAERKESDKLFARRPPVLVAGVASVTLLLLLFNLGGW